MVKLLIVEDEKPILNFLEDFFKEKGQYKVLRASGGKEAIEILKKENPEIAILDIKMDDISGMDVLKEAKKLNKDIKVIMTTVLRDESFEVGAKKLGCFRYYKKPLDLKELVSAIEEAAKSINNPG